jgi:hypothetical protein
MYEIEHFIPARERDSVLPLQGYLPPLPADVLGRYLSCYTEPGGLAVDPMAQGPTLPLVAARLQRKAVASNFNPINALLVRGLLSLPSPEELDAATTRLGDSLKRGIPLRDYINQLYVSTCDRCSGSIVVEQFLWDQGQAAPVEKTYHCPHCANHGSSPTQTSDLDALDAVEAQGVHFWYLLERLAQPHQAERPLAEDLLNLYTSRNLSALADISMRIESLFAASPLRSALSLILLSCLDTCSKLVAAPAPRATVLRLQPPSKFVERNVWHAFEEAYRHLRTLAPSAHVALGSEFEDLLDEREAQALALNLPLRKLSATLPPASVSLVISAPQAYYRPFWTLSYLWSGWLWGRHKAALLKPMLRRKVMGWSWYRRTLAAALRTLHRPLKPHGKMVFLLEGSGLTQVSNLILATLGAAFKLDRILYQPKDAPPPRHPMQGVPGAYRLTFSRDSDHDSPQEVPSPDTLALSLGQAAHRAIGELLRERGEALHLSWLHSAVYERWARDGLLALALLLDGEMSVADFLQQQLKAALEEGLETAAWELLPMDPRDPDGPQLWWLAGKAYPPLPLSDRLEEAVYETLQADPNLADADLEDTVYSRFPGLFTPSSGLLQQCLHSYGVPNGVSGVRSLRSEDHPESLTRERNEALALLADLGRRLGYQVPPTSRDAGSADGLAHRPHPRPADMDAIWEENGLPGHLFAVKQTTRLGDVLSKRRQEEDEAERFILISDRRLELLRFRIETELLLPRALAEGRWQFIKLNHLRRLAQRQKVHRHDLKHIVGLEPPAESPDTQLPLFS